MTWGASFLLSIFLCFNLAAADCQGDEGCDVQKATSRVLLQKSRAGGKEQALSEETKHGSAGRSGARIVKRHSVRERPFMPGAADKPEEKSECMEFYEKFLKGRKGLGQIAAVWLGLCSTEEMRATWKEVKRGCLYLPTDEHMVHFRDCAEHPNPWHNVYFLEDLFFKVEPGDSCPSTAGHGESTAEGGDSFRACADAEGFEGEDGACVSASKLEDWEVAQLRIFTLDGLMGLDDGIVQMMSWQCSRERVAAAALLAERRSNQSVDVARYQGRQVTIPVKFVVCEGSAGGLSDVTDARMMLNVVALNRAYGGTDQCTRRPGGGDDGSGGSLEVYDVPRANMGITFRYHSYRRVVDQTCEEVPLVEADLRHVANLAPREDGFLTVLITNFASILGFGMPPGNVFQFPFHFPPVIMVEHRTLPLGSSANFNEGHTLSHEIGHYFGLWHTFQGGCEGGDDIADTAAEESPYYGCPDPAAPRRTCDGSIDPGHNIMDYSRSYCKCSFTQEQRARVWQTIETYAPDIWQMSRGGCVDNPAWGERCAFWANHECGGAFFGAVVRQNCPGSCGNCP